MDVYTFKPIGYVQSPFTFKNGTPRQASVCRQARGIITIDKAVFNNPEHSLQGLEDFTHVWILFIFHKNNNTYTRAKVKPPRLNGARVGLFSTRSPYRPNNIGLTLAKIENVQGASITVSGIDILDGTPVIDLKPYIAQYDHPDFVLGSDFQTQQSEDICTSNSDLENEIRVSGPNSQNTVDENESDSSEKGVAYSTQQVEAIIDKSVSNIQHKNDLNCDTCDSDSIHALKNLHTADSVNMNRFVSSRISEDSSMDVAVEMENAVESILTDKDDVTMVNNECASENVNHGCVKDLQVNTAHSPPSQQGEHLNKETKASSSAEWINSPPVSTLHVQFTERAADQLKLFTATSSDPRYRLKFMKTTDEVKEAILNILHEDPRSVYRRTKCVDSLYYFTVDVVHVTCWFDKDGEGGCESIAEVVRVKPACEVEQCRKSFIK